MTAPLTLRLKHNASEFEPLALELSQLLAGAPAAFVDRLAATPNGVRDLFEFGTNSSPASRTNELTVTLKPTEFMNRLMATARAGEFDMSVFERAPEHERAGHG
jgi:hypothetical protein